MKIGDIVNPETLPEGAKFQHTGEYDCKTIWTVKAGLAYEDGLDWGVSIASAPAKIISLPETKPAPTRRQVRDFLRRLGKTPEEVAKKLAKRGFKGRRQRHYYCPVAKALKARFGEGCSMRRDAAALPGMVVEAPEAVKGFVLAFDKGQFPDLVA